MRLKSLLAENQLFYLPIEMKFLERKEQFDDKINSYICP